MSQAKKIRIHILNPAGGCGHTSLEHARRYVRRGAAVWEGGAIRFVEERRDRKAVLASARASVRYDDGLASLKAVEGLPVAGDVIRLYTGRRSALDGREDRVVEVSTKPSPCRELTPRVPTWTGIPLVSNHKWPELKTLAATA